MISIRWPDGIVKCPYCGKENPAWMPKAKLYFCSAKHEKQKFSLKVGTIFEESPIRLEKWLPAAWLIVNCKNGISSYEVARAIGVTQKSAWFMMHRLREALAGAGITVKMGGPDREPIEIDETGVGPLPHRMHRSRRLKLQTAITQRTHKVQVMGMLDRETRQVRAQVIPNVKRETLQNVILNHIEGGATIYTDQFNAYDRLPAAKEFIHETVNHMQEYVRGQVHTQGIENFWSLLKRTLRGTYVAVEPFHLERYVAEQVFRFNNHATKENPLNDSDRFIVAMMQVVGKRLTYAELTGKQSERPAN
jgi:transposase-like protein